MFLLVAPTVLGMRVVNMKSIEEEVAIALEDLKDVIAIVYLVYNFRGELLGVYSNIAEAEDANAESTNGGGYIETWRVM